MIPSTGRACTLVAPKLALSSWLAGWLASLLAARRQSAEAEGRPEKIMTHSVHLWAVWVEREEKGKEEARRGLGNRPDRVRDREMETLVLTYLHGQHLGSCLTLGWGSFGAVERVWNWLDLVGLGLMVACIARQQASEQCGPRQRETEEEE